MGQPILNKRTLRSPYTMYALPVLNNGFFGGKRGNVVGYQAYILDADGYIAGIGLESQLFATPADVGHAWGDRPVQFNGVRDEDWVEWCRPVIIPEHQGV